MKSVVDAVREHAAHTPNRVCFTYVSLRHGNTSKTWGEVADAAARAAAWLRENDVKRGDIVVLIGSHNPDFYGAWLGVAWIGAVPTVLAEPGVRVQKDVYWSRTSALLERIGARALLVDPRVTMPVEVFTARRATYDELVRSPSALPESERMAAEDLLLLQHSSGTTGLQKGVMLTHGAVMAHAAAYGEVTSMTSDDVVASWLPLYHDMGLIACFVGPLIAGTPVVWLSPLEWAVAPGSLLDAVTRHAATLCWLPNFAFAFLAARVRGPSAHRLSSLRTIVNCSETVTAAAMDAFADRFAGEGLDRAAIATCYAMAENVFAMTSTSATDPPRRRTIDRSLWRDEHRAVAPASDAIAITHVSCGRALPGVDLRIVDDAGAEVAPLHAGRVLVRSDFLFRGYFRRDDLNGALLDADGFFDTGDLGYVDEDEHLTVTGRRKDVIIVAGRNIYPHDVEAVIDGVSGVHPGRAVAFGVAVRGAGTDGIAVLAESDLEPAGWPTLARSIQKTVATVLDLDLVDVLVVAPQSLRKSTSGKLARSGNRDWYLAGRFGSVANVVDADAAERSVG